MTPGIGFAVASLAAARMRLVCGDISALLLTRPHGLIWIALGAALRRIAALIEAGRHARGPENDGGARPG